MDDYQLSYLDEPMDPWKNNQERVLGDFGIKSETTLVMNKLGQVIDITNPKVYIMWIFSALGHLLCIMQVDVCFLVDCTGSMQPSIQTVKENIQDLYDELVAVYKKCDVLFAFVRYTDFDQPSGTRTTYLNFTQWVL